MRKLLTLVVTAGAVLALGSTASAQPGAGSTLGDLFPSSFRASLDPVPHDPAADAGSNVTGVARLSLTRDLLFARISASGLSALPHAMHIHGKNNPEVAFCPGADRRDDLVDDGLIETVEGLDDYGPVQVSFTTTGDTSAASVLALDRFPVASSDGRLTYIRVLRIPAEVAANLDDKHIVIHGVDLDGNGAYNGRTTALGAPLEGDLPVACGEIERKPFGLGFPFPLPFPSPFNFPFGFGR